MGYVGVVTAACLAAEGHSVIGVDISSSKVDALNKAQSPIIEERIEDLIRDAVQSGKLVATSDAEEAIAKTEMAIVCVGTPSLPNGAIDQSFVTKVISQIAAALQKQSGEFLVVVRSTMTPGTMRNLIIPVLEASNETRQGAKTKVVFHPEFLREGSSVYDFYNPPKIVVGEAREGDAKALLEIYGDKFQAPRIVCDVEIAEMVKYCDNMFHALKVTFANEVGAFCRAKGIDSHHVMNIFCQDTKLNISHRYLRPGFAFGGSCLPKDLRAFLAEARKSDISVPMIEGILPSNRQQIEKTIAEINERDTKRIGFYGLAFKAGTDDLRESPYLELAERLIGKGKSLRIFDPLIKIAQLVGANKEFLERKLPHITQYLVDRAEDMDGVDFMVCCHSCPQELINRWVQRGIAVYDLNSANRLQAAPSFGSADKS